MTSCTRGEKQESAITSVLGQLYNNSKSRCVTKVFVPLGIHIKSGWANTGFNSLQGILKVFHLDVPHLQMYTRI